jgi:hypothetical protein
LLQCLDVTPILTTNEPTPFSRYVRRLAVRLW